MNEEMVRRKKGGKREKERKASRRKEERKEWRKKYIPQIFQDSEILRVICKN